MLCSVAPYTIKYYIILEKYLMKRRTRILGQFIFGGSLNYLCHFNVF